MEFEFELSKDEMVEFDKVVRHRIGTMARAAIGGWKFAVVYVVAWVPIGIGIAAFAGLYIDHPWMSSDLNTIVIAAGIAAALLTVAISIGAS